MRASGPRDFGMNLGGGQSDRAAALGESTAQMLLDTNSILYRPDEPFVFSSGWASPVYVDVKRLIGYPLARSMLIDLAIERVLATVGFDAFDAIAGGEVGGVPFAAIIADRLRLPLVIVRKQAKGFGPGAQTAGMAQEGKRVLLVEDLTTDGRTKALFCKGLRQAGAEVRHAFVIFKYGIFDNVVRDLDAMNVDLFALATWDDVLPVARRRAAFPPDVMDAIEAYVADPVGWSARHGGLGRDEAVRQAIG